MSIQNWPGGVINKTPPTPSGPFETSTASGVWTLQQAADYVKQGNWPTAGNVPRDPDFEYVTMLLHGDGTNGGQNNTFLDSSTNNFTITRNGNTTQGSFSPYGPNWSNYFDGASDYFNLGYQSALELTSQNFTIEFWLNQSTAAVGMICGTWRTNSSSYVWGVFSSSGGLGFSYSTTGSYQSANDGKVGTSVSLGVWMHIAIVRNGTTLTLYKDGVAVSTSTSMTDPVASGQQFWIGGNSGDSQWLGGYLSNMRITNTVVYTANFTPPTAPSTAISGTQLLTCQNNRFRDNSANNFALTVVGTPSVQRFSPFAPTSPGYTTATIGGSGYFDGNGDFLNVPSITLSGNFTIEGWVNQTSLAQNGPQISVGADTSSSGTILLYLSTGGQLAWFINNSGGNGSTSVSPGTWNHVAMVRSGSTITMYLNGVSQGTDTSSTTISGVVNIASTVYSSTRFFGAGYASNVRITTTAVYTGNFTPPTAPVTAITNTQLLLNFTNAAIFDNAMMNDLETVGNAQISTSVVKFGTGSIAFDGSGDYLRPPFNQGYVFGTGNFTIEMWLYLSTGGTLATVFDFRPNANGAYPYVWMGTDNKLNYYVNSSTVIAGTTALSTGTWSHFAVCRSGTSTKMFLNGIQEGSTYTDTSNYICGSYGPTIGAEGSNLYSWNGYIDELRITKGVARYTANFTPPTAAFPNL